MPLRGMKTVTTLRARRLISRSRRLNRKQQVTANV
jgi:hypothetical protein